MKSIIHNLFNQMSLEKKLVTIVSVIIIATIGSLNIFSIHFIKLRYEEMLYQSMSSSSYLITYLLNSHLDTVVQFTDVLRSDSTIQRHLDIIHQDLDYHLESSYEKIYKVQQTCYQQYRKPYLTYSAIINPRFTTYTYGYGYEKLSTDMIEEINHAARKAKGAPVWFSRYVDNSYLFLARQIRKIEHMELYDMGTLAIAIDMDVLLDEITKESRDFQNIYWIFSQDDQIIYSSPKLERTVLPELRGISGKYGIISAEGHFYFALRGRLEGPDWEYFQLIPYDAMESYQKILVFAYLAVFLLGLILTIFLIHLSIRKLTAHIGVLCQKMASFHGDNTDIIQVPYDYSQRKDEIGLMHQYFDSMAQKVNTLITNDYKLNLEMKTMQLKSLEAQINPHFLYNTLDSINWRAKASGNEEISIMVEALGTLLRSSLSQKSSLVPLKEEMELVRRYLAIQKIRYEERLVYSFEINGAVPEKSGTDLAWNPCERPDSWMDGVLDSELAEVMLPPFSIQPFVENAIKYGLERFPDQCSVIIAVSREPDNTLYIMVKNDGSQFEANLLEKLEQSKQNAQGLGIGLLNINQRIKLLFGTEYGLTLYNKDGFAVAAIHIPITFEKG